MSILPIVLNDELTAEAGRYDLRATRVSPGRRAELVPLPQLTFTVTVQ